jgi:glutathione S-transferase
MLTLYRSPDCPNCTKVQEILEELAVAHDVFEVDSPAQLPAGLRHHATIPLLVDEDEVVQGPREIVAYLEKFEKFKELWYKFQSDACYCGEDGGIE